MLGRGVQNVSHIVSQLALWFFPLFSMIMNSTKNFRTLAYQEDPPLGTCFSSQKRIFSKKNKEGISQYWEDFSVLKIHQYWKDFLVLRGYLVTEDISIPRGAQYWGYLRSSIKYDTTILVKYFQKNIFPEQMIWSF